MMDDAFAFAKMDGARPVRIIHSSTPGLALMVGKVVVQAALRLFRNVEIVVQAITALVIFRSNRERIALASSKVGGVEILKQRNTMVIGRQAKLIVSLGVLQLQLLQRL